MATLSMVTRSMVIPSMVTFPEYCVRNAASLVVTVCVLALGAALVAQHVFDLQPCQLCVYQRWAYVAAGLAGFVALAVFRTPARAAGRATLVGLAALAFAAGAATAGFHVGVEQGWWPGSAACVGAAGTPDSVDQLRQQLMAAPVVRCDEVAWALFGVSMAGWNFLASVVFAAASLYAATRLLGPGETP